MLISLGGPCPAIRTGAAIILFAVGVAATTPAVAQAAIQNMIGSWDGSGRIAYTDGSSESIHCNAYDTGGGNSLKMAIQCKSEKNTIHIRSALRVDGTRVSGDWEERTFNVSGSASGRVEGGSMTLALTGGGFTGTMSVSFSKATQGVTIATQGIAMSRANMNFNRRQ